MKLSYWCSNILFQNIEPSCYSDVRLLTSLKEQHAGLSQCAQYFPEQLSAGRFLLGQNDVILH